MGWRGIVFGGIVGGILSRGALGAVFGAWTGHGIEEEIRRRRLRGGKRGGAGFASPEDKALAAAYKELGVKAQSPDATVRRAYRELAKKYHPDAVRARGLSDVEAAKADEKMKRINLAWGKIKDARGL